MTAEVLTIGEMGVSARQCEAFASGRHDAGVDDVVFVDQGLDLAAVIFESTGGVQRVDAFAFVEEQVVLVRRADIQCEIGQNAFVEPEKRCAAL